MIRRIFDWEKESIGRATIIIAVFSLLAKISGLIRDAIFSNQFGTGIIIDSYFAAFRIPDFIFNLLILGTFSVAFIPIFSEFVSKDKERAYKLASGIFNATFLGIFFLSFFAFLLARPLVSIIAPGFNSEEFDLTVKFTRILLLSPIFLTLSSVLSSILNTYKRFTLFSIVPIIYNLSIIFGVLVLYPIMGPTGLAFGVVLGAFLHFLIQLPQVFALGFRYSVGFFAEDLAFWKFWKLYWPRIFSMGIGQITLLIATVFGSFLSTGALSAFYYANNLQSVFLGIFAVSASLAVFPTLSEFYNKKDEHAFKNVLAKTAIQILFFIIPLSVLMLIMRAQIVRLILGVGQNTNFTFDDTRVVSLTLGLFVVSMFAQALTPLFARAFYARHNTIIPVIIGLITAVINIFVTYFLMRSLGIPGLALAFSITSIIYLILLLVELHRKIGNLNDEYLTINVLKISIAAVIAGIFTFLSLYLIAPWVDMQTYLGVFLQAVGAGSIGIFVYFGSAWFLNLDEAKHFMIFSRDMLKKITKPIGLNWNIKE